MKKRKGFFYKNGLSILIIVLILVVICLFLFCRLIAVQLFNGFVASIIAVAFGILKQRIEQDRLFKELFESFNSKYNGEINDIFNELRRHPQKKINDIKINGENLIIDYFNLCSEEYLWFSKGRIPKDVWKAWEIGINENLKISQVKALYIKEMESSSESYYGLDKELNI